MNELLYSIHGTAVFIVGLIFLSNVYDDNKTNQFTKKEKIKYFAVGIIVVTYPMYQIIKDFMKFINSIT